jgi:coronin-1B/1C/6
MKVVRDSKFRHVHGDATKQKYEDLRLTTKATESTGIRGNSKFFAFGWDSGGGGTLACIPNTRFGRLPRDLPLITGHSGAVLDFEFNPFDDNMLISASEDLTIKVWSIPDDGIKEHMREPVATLEGHGKKITFCTFNPVASSIVASAAFDQTVRLWNLAEQEQAFLTNLPENAQVNCLKWNYTGSLLAATCKDKKLRIIDPRQQSIVSECVVHGGVKASKVVWLGSNSVTDDCHKLVTTGFSPQAERCVAIWDTRMFKSEEGAECEPLNQLTLDSGTGALYPFFDEGAQMLYIAGKGDANVRYFEVTAQDPYLHYISDYRSTVAQKGFELLPKRCVDVMSHEIAKGLKLETTSVQPISFKVPRKSEAFQEDLFPQCPAGVPAMAADAFLSGAEGCNPILRSMKPGEDKVAKAAPTAGTGVVSMKDLKKQLAEAQAKIEALEKENAQLKEEVAQLKSV